MNDLDGILLIDKPAGPTSAEVVRRVKRRTRTRVGHLGTLDPFASGLLPLCLGEGSKVVQFLNVADKRYQGTIRLGVSSDTGDPTGTRTFYPDPLPSIGEADLRRLEREFVGPRLQTPPMYSALKRDGQPLYKLARAGVVVDRQPRPITIHRLRLTQTGDDQLSFEVWSSKGTYVRVLAEEIARALGTVGHLETLRRTGFGAFDIDSATPLGRLDDPQAPLSVIGLRAALAELSEIVVPDTVASRVQHGDRAALQSLAAPTSSAPVRLATGEGRLLAVIAPESDGGWHYARVF